jgi:hypothetical protein
MPSKSPYYFEGKTLHEVIVSNRSFKCKTRVPDKHKLFNFDLKTKEETWLVLDDYGNEVLPPSLVDRILGEGSFKKGYTLAINRRTGQTYLAIFYTEKRKNSVTLHELSPVVPKAYLKRLDELKSRKRPFYITLVDSAFAGLLDQELGYGDLEDRLVLDLEFKGSRIQVQQENYRLVSNWK